MSSINFYLKPPNRKNESLIMMSYLFRGEKFRYCTKLKITPAQWRNQRVKANFPGYSEINGILDDIENRIKSIEREALFTRKHLSLELKPSPF